MTNVRLVFGGRSANIGGRNTVVQGNVVNHQHNQAAYGRKKLQTPGAATNKYHVFANQGAGIGQSPKRIRNVGEECVYGPTSPTRHYKDVCEHTTGIKRERVINKPRAENASPRRNRPYGASPAAASIRPPTGSGGFAASVSPSLGSPTQAKWAPADQPSPRAKFVNGKRVGTPMPGAAASGCDRVATAGFKKTNRGFHVAQQYHQDVTAPAFAAKHRTRGPQPAIGQLADFGNMADPGVAPPSIQVNRAVTNNSSGVASAIASGPAPHSNHRNTMGGVRPGGANYLNHGQRRRVVQPTWNSSTESQPHEPGMHHAAHHPLSPRRLCAISPSKAQEIQTRKGAMADIIGHAHVQ